MDGRKQADRENPLCGLLRHGQSVWMDQLRRDWIEDGQLERWIAHDCLRGVTSNPSIFAEAVAESASYDGQLRQLAEAGLDTREIFDRLTMEDIRRTCDVFRPVYEQTGGVDGYVSHEVSPELAYDTEGTIDEVRRLWTAVDRPNLLVKIPATEPGIPAIRSCLEAGVNINITLMFSLEHYEAVAEAYLSALETRVARGQPVHNLASVASFFVSRVETLVDERLDALSSPAAASLRGKSAVANAKRAYRRFEELFLGGERFAHLATYGARPQRVLWASTSTKDPAYSDVKYVDALIGPYTVNTLPRATFEAVRDHAAVATTVTAGLDEADRVVEALEALGIDLDEVGQTLSERGVEKFDRALQEALETVEQAKETA